MKIALLTDGIQPYVIGGMQRHSYFIAKYLAKNKVFVDLYHCRQTNEADINKLEVFTEEEKKYIRSFVVDFPEKDYIPSVFSPLLLKDKFELPIKFPGHYLRRSYRYSEKIYEVLINNLTGVDFIYCKGFSGWKLIEEKNSRGAEGEVFPPIGIKFHGLNMFQTPPSFKGWLEQFMFRPAVKFNVKNADFVFSYGGKITGITKKIGVPDSKIIEIPTGIENSWIKNISEPRTNSKLKFLYVGRYERLKGIQEISKAIKNLSRTFAGESGGEGFEFHFIGPIPDQLKLHCNEVKYLGQISSSEEIKKIMDSLDFLVLSSYSEGMPNVIIEAMARGLAIIATDVGAVNSIVNSENGFLLEQCSVENIENAMLSAISLPAEKLIQMKDNSMKKIKENFLWENIATKLIAQLNEIVQTKTKN